MVRLHVSLAACLLLMLASCATPSNVAPGHDPLVVNAEQAQQSAFEAVDSFLAFEHAHRDLLWSVDPGIKRAADRLRQTFPGANESLLRAIDAYKSNRTQELRANLNTWLAVVETARVEAQRWVATAAER